MDFHEMLEHLFEGFPEGRFTWESSLLEARFLIGLHLGVVIIPLLWIVTNAPLLSTPALIYLLFDAIALSMIMVEMVAPLRSTWSALLSGTPESHVGAAVVGLMSVVPALIASRLIGAVAPIAPASVIAALTPQNVMAVFFIVVIAPFVEETFWTLLLLPSMVKNFGVLPGIAFTTITFAYFHWAVYGGSAYALTVLAIFRLVTHVACLYTEDWYTGLAAHITNNALAVLILLR